MKKTITKLSTLVLLLLSTLSYGQSLVTGSITDDTGEELIGVTVRLKGTSIGALTDIAGVYTMNVPAGDHVISANYVGYQALEQEVSVGEGETVNLDFVLSVGTALDEVVVIGSRAEPRTIIDSPTAVDVLDIEQIAKTGAQTNVNQILQFAAPSFTSNTQTISDGTDHIDPASLRALGPDQVLVLINGKRRHTSSLVNVNGTFGRGNVGTDMNAIPVAAIDRIEVLRDGAAAQYGSDAIAGVINIVLKQDYNRLQASVTGSGYLSENSNFQTGGMDGENADISLNYGIPLNDKGGFINFTGNYEYRDWTSRMKEWEGSIFNGFNAVEWAASQDGYNLSQLQDNDLSDIFQYASQAGISLTGNESLSELQDILGNDYTDAQLAARGLSRSDFNMRVGQSELRGAKFFTNMSIPINENAEIYAFGGVSNRDGEAAGFYRLPNQSRTYTPAYINGFLPEIHTDISDKSLTAGINGKLKDWKVDFSNVVGQNSFLYNVHNSSNASLANSTPFEFNSGGFSFLQNTTNVDFSRYYSNTLSGLNLAFGAETRVEKYQIEAGSQNSYTTYDINGLPVVSTTPSSSLVRDFFGSTRAGGAQVFPGFQPSNELSELRNTVAFYTDVEADITDSFLISGALRFENYSDFGSTINGKVSSRLKLSENASLRGTGQTGFRAPSLHQIYFNSTSTLFIDGIPNEVGTFSNSSRVARLLGIPQLKEETSVGGSIGFTGRIPDAGLSFTVDGYIVNIDDRVVLTGTFDPSDGITQQQQDELASLFAQANAESATFFANAINTETTGIDIVISHDGQIGSASSRTSLSGTFSNTEIKDIVNVSEPLQGLEEVYVDETSRIFLEEGVPRTKFIFVNSLDFDKVSTNLSLNYFGEVSEATNNVANQQVFSDKMILNLSAGFNLSDNLNFTLGANNLFDTYPDLAIEANRSDGRFDWSRRSQQFGIQGRQVFTRLSLDLF